MAKIIKQPVTCYGWEIDASKILYSGSGLAHIQVREAEAIIEEELERMRKIYVAEIHRLHSLLPDEASKGYEPSNIKL